MNESLEDLACLYVLDQLDAPQRAAFETRLLREPEVAAYVRELEAAFAAGIRALPPHKPPASTLTRIEARIAARPVPVTAPPTAQRSREISWVSFARWGIAAVIALSLTTLAVQSLRRSPLGPVIVVVGLDTNRNTFTDLPLGNGAKDPDARFIQLATLAERFWQAPADLPFTVAKGPRGDSRGYALFDPGSQQGFIAVEQLPVISENQRFHLWILNPVSGEIRDAGILPLSGRNGGLYSFTAGSAGEDRAARPQIFITVEEAGPTAAPARPRGKVVLGNSRI